jgi:formimidoylglutamase
LSTAAPFTVPGVWPEIKPGRFAAGVRSAPEGCRCALLGLSDDLGVRLNGGRPGARGGPSAFRAALGRFGVPWDGLRRQPLDVPVYDAGDITPAPGDDASALLETHRRVENAVAWLHERGLVTVCIGGGHDLSLPSITALCRALGVAAGGINVDAHLDVRTQVGSGMPFRRLIESKALDPQRFVELGLGRFVNDAADLEWLSAQGGTLIHADELWERGLDRQALIDRAASQGPAFLSIDLDAFDQSVAPGVSAPNPLGVPLRDAVRLAEAAGAHPQFRHFDLMEFNPAFDVDARTGRVAALLFLSFMAGLGQRSP